MSTWISEVEVFQAAVTRIHFVKNMLKANW